ncbi:MAG: LytTR family transcriptional regulator DNA-binding domain-containing protein [Oscillospiraceae bacterium]|nr:LytTR family transcriptional regulator DNA-binding domain-containing protein [Oscillospiraceae bacterium]
MRQINIRFECDPSLDSIEILIQAPEQDEAVTALMEQISGRPQDTITVFDGKGGIRTIPTDEIVLASTDGKLVNLITEDGIWHVRRTLQSLEDALDGRRFIRISRYELVNLGKVRRYDFTVAGTLRLELAGGMETWAARRCIPEIRRRLQGRRDER